MTTQVTKIERFRSLHVPGQPLLMANAWDIGAAKVFEAIGYQAVGTTSSGFAATMGRLDGAVTRDEALEHAAAMVAATDVPVSADLENGFAHAAAGVADTVAAAVTAGLAGCSIEDFTGDRDDPIYERQHAVDRVTAAVETAQAAGLVLTARAENFVRGRPDLADTIDRLQLFQEAGADVLFAPGITAPDDIEQVVKSVDRPVNVLVRAGMPNVSQLAALGIGRISVGGALGYVGLAAVVEAARELLEEGTYEYLERATAGIQQARKAFSA
jgi:2-methylisocitrate lyase-like PEP mutase family enzyme